MTKKRQETNQKLVGILQGLVRNNPELRFSQILDVYGFVKETRPANPENRIDWQNEFYEEPEIILTRVVKRVKDIKQQ